MRRTIEKTYCGNCITREKSLFNNFPANQFPDLDLIKTCQVYKKGEVIFHEGGIPHGVYCVKYGKIKIFKTGIEGRDQIIRFAKGGDMLGYRSLLSNEKYNGTASCLDESALCFIPKENILKMVSANSCLAINIMKAACHEMGEASNIIVNLAQKSIKERLAEVLLILQSNFGLDENKAIQVILTREEIASMVGTATESVIRLLSEFHKLRIIVLDGKQIKLIDVEKLCTIAKINN